MSSGIWALFSVPSHLLSQSPEYRFCVHKLLQIPTDRNTSVLSRNEISQMLSSNGKASACNAGDPGLLPGSEDPLEKGWQSTPVFLPGEFHGQTMGLHIVGHDRVTNTLTLAKMQIRLRHKADTALKHWFKAGASLL